MNEWPKYVVFPLARCDKETEKRFHIITGTPDPNFWVPKSMCQNDKYNKHQIRKAGDKGEVNVNEWWLLVSQPWYKAAYDRNLNVKKAGA
jgi:hypothetical protein